MITLLCKNHSNELNQALYCFTSDFNGYVAKGNISG